MPKAESQPAHLIVPQNPLANRRRWRKAVLQHLFEALSVIAHQSISLVPVVDKSRAHPGDQMDKTGTTF